MNLFLTTDPVYVSKDDTTGNPYRLTPYINEKHEIWLHAEGNGCGDDVMLEDVEGKDEVEIARENGEFNLDAMHEFAEEIRKSGFVDEADWLVDWCDRVAKVMSRVRYATIDERKDGTRDQYTEDFKSADEAVAAAERDWVYLTGSEKRVRHICAVWSIADEDGEFDWRNYDIIKEFNA